MNKILIMILVIFGAVNFAFAQNENMGRKTAEQRTELITKNLSEKLALSAEQTEEVREMILKREKLRDAGKLSKDKQKDIHTDLNKILTRDQQLKWKEMKRKKENEKPNNE